MRRRARWAVVPPRLGLTVVVVAAAVVSTGCGARGAAEAAGGPVAPPPSVALPSAADGASVEMDVVLSVDFDEASQPLTEGAPVVDDSIHHMTGAVRLGGTAPQPLAAVEGREGMALRFPPPCDPTVADCPKGVVEFVSTSFLNPGTRDFRFGAAVLLTPEETSAGSNIVQKGFNTGGKSQWKLQVDGEAGHPSCVLVGLAEGEEVTVTAADGVADGTWHEVECARVDGHLVVSVDGVESRRKPVPEGMAVEPPGPVRVGGKSVKADNDQYFGVIDDVFVEIHSG